MSGERQGRPLMIPSWLMEKLEELGPSLEKAFDESKHRRYPKGDPKGGKFMPKGGGQVGGSAKDRPKIRLTSGEEVTPADEFEGEEERLAEKIERFREELQAEEAQIQAGNTALPVDWDGTIRVTVAGFQAGPRSDKKTAAAMVDSLQQRLSSRYPNATVEIAYGWAGAGEMFNLDRAAMRATQEARGIDEDEAFEQRRALDGEILHDLLMS